MNSVLATKKVRLIMELRMPSLERRHIDSEWGRVVCVRHEPLAGPFERGPTLAGSVLLNRLLNFGRLSCKNLLRSRRSRRRFRFGFGFGD